VGRVIRLGDRAVPPAREHRHLGRRRPSRYAEMVSEDRRLRLAGYEVFRFGGAELMDEERGGVELEKFIASLLDKPAPGHL